MPRSITPVCRFVLRNSKSLVAQLKRDCGPFMKVIDPRELELEKMLVFVPEGVLVYEITARYRNREKLFFTTTEGDWDPAFLTLVEPGHQNYVKNVSAILSLPWYTQESSSYIFDRIFRQQTNVLNARDPDGRGPHPLLIKR